MAQRAGVPWLPDDESPPAVHINERVILWGTWVTDKPPAPRRAQASAAATPRPSSSSAAAPGPSTPVPPAPPPPPPAAPQPMYRLMQHLIGLMEQSERRNRRRYERLSRMLASLGTRMPSDSDISSN
ncbi:uncharacterized protein LOC110277406 [Arachis duranensis]|uniref:Uncharacterized protein LOC110277406 n=1 Tax=Arachis duranensis TaxID=130453 RepID=A0A9C6T9V8_ARADU|nr:uncharacterized protein LOC110281049 [Arachis duranensis]XP_052114224.1 uncharacterized protein LOC110277406 [Arachis duranensis]